MNRQNLLEHLPWDSDLGHLECDGAAPAVGSILIVLRVGAGWTCPAWGRERAAGVFGRQRLFFRSRSTSDEPDAARARTSFAHV